MSQLLLLFTPQTTHCITWWRTCLLWMPPLLLSQCMLFAQTHIQIWGFSWNSIKLSVFSNNTYNAHFLAITVGPLVTTLSVCGSFDVMFSFTPACRWYIVLTHEEVTWQDTKKSQDAAMNPALTFDTGMTNFFTKAISSERISEATSGVSSNWELWKRDEV